MLLCQCITALTLAGLELTNHALLLTVDLQTQHQFQKHLTMQKFHLLCFQSILDQSNFLVT